MDIRRREFIGLMAGAAAGAAAGFPAGRGINDTLSSADQPLRVARGTEQWMLSVCNACPGGCGVKARRIGDRVVKLDGNPLHPISGGRLCPKGQAALQALYHPDRLRSPMQRFGPRGSAASFRPVPWDVALSDIADRLRALRAEQRPESLVLLRGADRGIGTRVARRFAGAFGTPNDIAFDRASEAGALALYLTQGVRAVPAPDIRAADYILSVGSEILEASASPVYAARAYGDFRRTHARRRGKLVHADPRLSITAASADEWIAIRPGTEAVFTLGLATALVMEGLYDRDFVADHCTGFEDGPGGGLRTMLPQRFPLERVASETGVSVNVILRIARELAAAQRALVLAPHKGPLVGSRALDHLAVHILNALLGNIDRAGGVLVPEEGPLDLWPAPHDSIAAAGHRRPRLDGVNADSMIASDPEQLAQSLVSGQPYRAEVVFVAGTDPLYATTARARFTAALDRVPMVVAFASILNDTALHADWILPETHFLEQWNLHTSPASVAFPIVSLSSPASKPLHDVRSVSDVFVELAKRIGLEEAFPWPDTPALIRADVERLHQARRGAIVGTPFDAAWVRMMEGAGWWAPGYTTADELWQRALDAGGWWDPFYDHGDWNRVLRGASRLFDFRPDVLHEMSDADVASPENRETLALLLFEPLPTSGGTGAELPFLQAILDPGHEERWGTWGEIHHETAEALHIRNGQPVRVASANEAIVVRARVTDRVVPGAIAIPVGLGKVAGGRWAAGIGANPLPLLDGTRESFSTLTDFGAGRVAVSEVPRSGRTRRRA